MKTTNIVMLILLLLTVIIMSCETCPPSEHLGIKELFPISKTFIPNLQKGNIVIYIDSAGNEMEFLVESRETTFENHSIGIYCTTYAYGAWSDNVDVETTTIKLKTQIPFNNTITNVEYKFKVTNIQTDSLMSRDTNNIFYDVLEIDNNFSMPISNRGNDIFDYTEITSIADTTILGKDFTEVYPIENIYGQKIFYTKEQGIVAFLNTDSILWVFDRIE